MKGEIIQTILTPKLEDDWVLIQTDKCLYSFRLGGFKLEEPIKSIDDFEVLSCPFKNRQIQEIYTDDEWVYVIVDGGGIIASGWTEVNLSGAMDLGVKFTEIDEYGTDFFESNDFFQLVSGSDGRSKKI